MDLVHITSLNYEDLNDEDKETIFNVFVNLKFEDTPKRSLRKTFELALDIIKFKGEQVTVLQDQIEKKAQDDQKVKVIYDENDQLKEIVSKLEVDRLSLKRKIKEINEELIGRDKRSNQAASLAESDKDSSDPLSELDRHEVLLKNISTKNKHIKRLIREIDSLQLKNIDQSKSIIDQNNKLDQLNNEYQKIVKKLNGCQHEKSNLIKTIDTLNAEINRLEGNITYLEDEREKSENEFKNFIEKLENRAANWQRIIDEKEQQMDSMRKKFELLNEEKSGNVGFDLNNKDETSRLVEAIQERDGIIDELENRLKAMAGEMMASTRLMNKLSADRENDKKDILRKKSCCKTIEDSLILANNRCKELSEMLEKIEEDNMVKSKQVNDAMNALSAYQNGEDGLEHALRKIANFEQKILSRDKQIKSLVKELNSLNEISQENLMLRKKFNIPDDVEISKKNVIAKERNKDKMIELLRLKLRASEEMRLKLKLEKSDLQKQLIDKGFNRAISVESDANSKNGLSKNSLETKRQELYCDNCLKNIQKIPIQDDVIQDVVKEWEIKYAGVIEENENLRVGMHEILERIRDYDATSDHITIDCEILSRVLQALDARSVSGWYHPAMGMQNEIIAVKEKMSSSKDNEQSHITNAKTESNNNIEIQIEIDDSSLLDDGPIEEKIKSTQEINLYPLLAEINFENDLVKTEFLKILQKNRHLQLENEKLKIFEAHYNEMKINFNKNDNYCDNILERFTQLEIDYQIQNKKYEFMMEDYNKCLTDYKASEMKNIIVIADLKKQINNRKHEINLLKSNELNGNFCNIKEKYFKTDDDYLLLQKNFCKLQTHMALIISNIFQGKYPELQIPEIGADYGIIDENLQLDYLTINEFEMIKSDNISLEEKFFELSQQCQFLSGQLNISQEQVKTQQKLLSEITDNHIDLRHLVADLTSNEDKFIIAKVNRDLDSAKHEILSLKSEKDLLQENLQKTKILLAAKETEVNALKEDFLKQFKSNELKTKFLKKSILILQQKYIKFTPIVFLSNFIYSYNKHITSSQRDKINIQDALKNVDEILSNKLSELSNNTIESKDLIELVKYESKCKFLEEQLSNCEQKLSSVQNELHAQILDAAANTEHWKTIVALFGDKDSPTPTTTVDISTQINIETNDQSTNTDNIRPEIVDIAIGTPYTSPKSSPKSLPNKQALDKSNNEETQLISPSIIKSPQVDENLTIISLENQLQQAIQLATIRNSVLLETENRLVEAQSRNKEMENTIVTLKELITKETFKNDATDESARQQTSNIFETTISSFQSMLTEKDTTINHYQDLLKSERDQYLKLTENYSNEIGILKKAQIELDTLMKGKDMEIFELKTRLEAIPSRRNSKEKVDVAAGVDDNGDNSLNELSDEKIEEMFKDDSSKNLQTNEFEVQLREAKNREIFLKNSLRTKEEELSILQEKYRLIQQNEREFVVNPEIEQLRLLLEEKDKNINDLMETLTSFHDDQQEFISETTHYSADQISQLGADLNRSEGSNKILQTQVEALRRQLNSLSQREKQSRDLANTLKTQLIKRPVVSIKSELNSRTKYENLQKRVQQLETELDEARMEIKKQHRQIEAKRAKTSNEVGLWEKQKRWQQNAEKLKVKLEETSASLEKTRSLLNGARVTINRLEKDKHILEMKLQRGHGHMSSGFASNKCCRTPSCPNLLMTKYGQSDTPDTMTGGSECSSPIRGQHCSNTNSEIFEALKTRNEIQQRRIIAMELEGRGSNALTTEFEKLQEKLSHLEAENIRMEAKNLQLQLDNDILKKDDESDRLHKRIKHLEDYIIALKEELARTEAQRDLDSTKTEKKLPHCDAEQTILSLKRIVDKLRVENKNLKHGRGGRNNCRAREEMPELPKLQQLYTEALDRISALEIELQLKNCPCPRCGNTIDNNERNTEMSSDLKIIKNQLIKKSQLLEKAKILLTRAAAKEKLLKDQLFMWKRKCSELQNVPVIDEISE